MNNTYLFVVESRDFHVYVHCTVNEFQSLFGSMVQSSAQYVEIIVYDLPRSWLAPVLTMYFNQGVLAGGLANV